MSNTETKASNKSIGEAAPDFTLYDCSRNRVSLSSYRGKRVLLAFIPAAHTGVCERELCRFRDSFEQLVNLNVEVLSISVDSPFANAAFSRKNNFGFPLLSDYDRRAVHAYGVAHENFVDLPGYTAAKRSIFVVEADGTISYVWLASIPSEEPDYKEIEDFLGK